MNSMRNIELYLNNSLLGTISNGKTLEFDLEPGTYNLRAQVDWCSSLRQEVRIADSDVKIIELSAYKHSELLLPAFIAGLLVILFSNLFQLDPSRFALLIFTPAFLYMIYRLTFGRNEYLQLKQVN